MSWITTLIPTLADFKTQAGWTGGDTPTPTPEEVTTTYYYGINYPDTVEITWAIQDATLTKVQVTFPSGGLDLVQTSGGVPRIVEAIYNAISPYVDTISFAQSSDVYTITYEIGGVSKTFSLHAAWEDEYTYTDEAADSLLSVRPARHRTISSQTISIADGAVNELDFVYEAPPTEVGQLSTTGGTYYFDTSIYAQYHDIQAPDTDAETLVLNYCSEYYYMTSATITGTT